MFFDHISFNSKPGLELASSFGSSQKFIRIYKKSIRVGQVLWLVTTVASSALGYALILVPIGNAYTVVILISYIAGRNRFLLRIEESIVLSQSQGNQGDEKKYEKLYKMIRQTSRRMILLLTLSALTLTGFMLTARNWQEYGRIGGFSLFQSLYDLNYILIGAIANTIMYYTRQRLKNMNKRKVSCSVVQNKTISTKNHSKISNGISTTKQAVMV